MSKGRYFFTFKESFILEEAFIMDYAYIEKLVISSKLGDEMCKELLVKEFTPFILSLSNKAFIHGYDKQDLHNECYKALFYCLHKYDTKSHRFVGYAINSIKNQISLLIKKSINHSSSEGQAALALFEDVENTIASNELNIEDGFLRKSDFEHLNHALNNLKEDERELIDYIFFKKNTVRTYAFSKNMSYSTAISKKNNTLKKIKKSLNPHIKIH